MKLWFRLLVLLIILAFFPLLLVQQREGHEELARAQADFDRAQAHYLAADEEMETAEQRLLRLTTSVAAVEDEVREQHRMIRPGETLVLIETPRQPR